MPSHYFGLQLQVYLNSFSAGIGTFDFKGDRVCDLWGRTGGSEERKWGTSFASYLGETSPTDGTSQGGHRKKTLLFSLLDLSFLVTGLTVKSI